MRTVSTLEGQTVLVIGGTSGIGLGVALASIDSAASKVIVASSTKEKVDSAVERLTAHATQSNKPAVVKGVLVDATDLADVDRAVKEAGVINHLVFTSGNMLPGLGKNISDVELSKAKEMGPFDVRYWAPTQAAKSAVFPPEGGSITFTSGVLTYKPLPGFSVLTGIGGAIDAITRGLAVDLAPRSIRVNTVSPGFIQTEPEEKMPELRRGFFEKAGNMTLAKRVGTPEDVAEAYMFLMKCGFISGESLKVDGGQRLA